MSGLKRRLVHHAGRLPFATGLLQRLAGCGFVTFCAHVVSDARLPHIRHLFSYRTVRQFESDLEILLKIKRPLGLDELAASVAAGIPPPADACLLTFDDGLREAGEIIAPLLRRRGVPAAFFVNSDFVDNRTLFFRHKASLIADALSSDKTPCSVRRIVDVLAAHGIATQDPRRAVLELNYTRRHVLDDIATSLGLDFDFFLKTRQPYLRLAELRALAQDGFAIGAHSRSHPLFAELSCEEQREQALSSIEFVRSKVTPSCLAFAFPFHDSGVAPPLFADLAAAGIKVSFGTAGLRRDTIVWNLHRIPAEDGASDILDDLNVACLKGVLFRLAGKGTINRDPLGRVGW